MKRAARWLGVAVALVLIFVGGPASAEMRTWTDSSGKYKMDAELVSATVAEVTLRREDGTEITLPLGKLSPSDRAFVRSRRAADTEDAAEPAMNLIRDVAERFFGGLRDKQRDKALATLSAAAQKVNNDEKSALAQLPAPDEGARSVRVGRGKVDGEQAEVPVQVRAGGGQHETTLHLRLENDEWRVFAISTTLGSEKHTLDLESEYVPPKKENPLVKLVGQPLPLEGLTLDGQPLDMSQYEGKVVLIDFWATWCGPCRAEMPNILANYQRFHEAGFEVIAISVDKDLKDLRQFVLEEQPPWTVIADRHPLNRKSMSATYGIQGIPAFILLGKDGRVAAVNSRGERLGKELEKLLGG